MEKGKGRNAYYHREIGKRKNNASNNKQGSYQSSLEKCVDSGHVSLSRHGTLMSLSSDTLDILELGPNSQLDDATLTSQSGLETENQLSRKLVADSNASLHHNGWEVSYEPRGLPSPPLEASMQQSLPRRKSQCFRMPAATLRNCSKTFNSSGKILKFPRQKLLRSHTHSISVPSRYHSSTASTSTSVAASSKLTTIRQSYPRSSHKSNRQNRFTCGIKNPYLVPKSHEKYFKGNINRASTFNKISNTRWDWKERNAFLDTSPDIDNPQLTTTPSQPSLSLSNNLSYNSSKTSKCTAHGPSLFQKSRFASSGVGVRLKRPLVQGRTGSEKKRSSPMTATRRRMLNCERHPIKPSLSLSNTYKNFSTCRSQKENKETQAAGYNILTSKNRVAAPQTAKYFSSKMTTKPPPVLKSRQTRSKNTHNNRFGQKRFGSERESQMEKTSSLSVSPKKAKRLRKHPEVCPFKYGSNHAKKASRVREPAVASQRASFLWGAARSKLGAASRTRLRLPSNSLKVFESLNDQQGTQNVKKTSILFKFRARRWMLEPSTGCVVQCGAEGALDRDAQDCFAAWELTQHEVLQSCRSEDLMIMNKAVSRSSPHSNIRKSSSTRMKKSKTSQSGTSPDKPKAALVRKETRVYTIAGRHPLLSLGGRSGHSLSIKERKSHSEYTSSTDISSETSRWSLTSSLYSNISPSKSQKPYADSSGLVKSYVKSRSGISRLFNQTKQQKHQKYRVRSNGESENRKQGSLKYRQSNQCRKSPGLKTLPNQVIFHREQPRQLKMTSMGFSNARRNKNKQGPLDLPKNPVGKQQGFLVNSNFFQKDSSVESVKSSLNWHKELISEKPNIPSGILSSNAVQPAVTAMEQAVSVRSSSIYSQKQTPQPSVCSGYRPNEVTGNTVSRFVRKESRKRTSDAKKCVLVTQNSQRTTFCLWKWRLLKLALLLLIAVSHYLAFVITIATV